MKKLMIVILMLLNTVAFADIIGAFNDLSGENTEATIPQNSWYWDPNQQNWGFGISVQRSKHGESGYFVDGAFYTYKEDGTQAWYKIQGDYVPNPDVNAWKETSDMYGTSWGGDSENTWMGKVEAQLAETSGGTPLGKPYRANTIFAVGDIKLVWRNPEVIEVYLDGATTPDHVLERYSWYGDQIKGDAGYLTKNYYRMVGMRNYFKDSNYVPMMQYIQSTMTFEEFDPDNYFASNAYGLAAFKSVIEANTGDKQFYISSRAVGSLTAQYMTKGDEYTLGPFDKKLFDEGLEDFIIMVYDRDEKALSGYVARGAYPGSPERGMTVLMNGYKFAGFLAPEDQGRISMHPAKCVAARCGDEKSFTEELTRRSSWHFFKVPDDTGMFYERVADTYEHDFGTDIVD